MRVIGRGKFGCVVTPALPCGEVLRGGSNTVSKITKPPGRDLDDFELAGMITEADPRGLFTVAPVALCKIPPAFYSDVEDVCGFVSSEHVVQPYGGKTLLELMREKVAPKTLLKSMIPIFKGFADVHRAGMLDFTHGDIKRDNIVVDSVNHARLIDFSKGVGDMIAFMTSRKELTGLTAEQLDRLKNATGEVLEINTIRMAKDMLNGRLEQDPDVIGAGFLALDIIRTYGHAGHYPMDFALMLAPRGPPFTTAVAELMLWQTNNRFLEVGRKSEASRIIQEVTRAVHTYLQTPTPPFVAGAFDMYSLGAVVLRLGFYDLAVPMLCANPWERITAPDALRAVTEFLDRPVATPGGRKRRGAPKASATTAAVGTRRRGPGGWYTVTPRRNGSRYWKKTPVGRLS